MVSVVRFWYSCSVKMLFVHLKQLENRTHFLYKQPVIVDESNILLFHSSRGSTYHCPHVLLNFDFTFYNRTTRQMWNISLSPWYSTETCDWRNPFCTGWVAMAGVATFHGISFLFKQVWISTPLWGLSDSPRMGPVSSTLFWVGNLLLLLVHFHWRKKNKRCFVMFENK